MRFNLPLFPLYSTSTKGAKSQGDEDDVCFRFISLPRGLRVQWMAGKVWGGCVWGAALRDCGQAYALAPLTFAPPRFRPVPKPRLPGVGEGSEPQGPIASKVSRTKALATSIAAP